MPQEGPDEFASRGNPKNYPQGGPEELSSKRTRRNFPEGGTRRNFHQGGTQKKKYEQIFGSIDSSFVLSKSIGDVPDDNIEEPNIFGCLITPEKNIEEPAKWVIAPAEQGT